MGAEASRRFYESIHIDPDFAPISQIIIVLVLGELAPLFAARRHPQHVAYITVPVIYFISKILTPIVYVIDGIAYLSNRICGRSPQYNFFLTRDEVQKTFEERSSLNITSDTDALNLAIGNIFMLKDKIASDMMMMIDETQMISSNICVSKLRQYLRHSYSAFIPIYHRSRENIVAITYPRDLLKSNDYERVIEYAKSPWFVTSTTPILNVMKQFRYNSQSIAIILNKTGSAIGVLTLDQIIDNILGEEYSYTYDKYKLSQQSYVERTLSADMLLSDFNSKFEANLSYGKAETINDLIKKILGHHPSLGEVVCIDNFEITVKELSLMGVKTVVVKTIK